MLFCHWGIFCQLTCNSEFVLTQMEQFGTKCGPSTKEHLPSQYFISRDLIFWADSFDISIPSKKTQLLKTQLFFRLLQLWRCSPIIPYLLPSLILGFLESGFQPFVCCIIVKVDIEVHHIWSTHYVGTKGLLHTANLFFEWENFSHKVEAMVIGHMYFFTVMGI